MPTEQAKLFIDGALERINGETVFTFKVDPRITAVYERQHAEIKVSEKWPGLQFYYSPGVVESPRYQAMAREYGLFDNYGQPIYKIDEGSRSKGLLNIAWLRTVGGEGKILVGDNVTIAEASLLMKQAAQFIKEYFQEHMRDYKIKFRVEMEG